MDIKKIIEYEYWTEDNDVKFDELSKGTRFIKHLTDFGDGFWLHTMYYPLNKIGVGTLIALISNKTGVKITKDAYEELVDFYSQCNGLSLFSHSFVIFGNPNGYDYVYLSEPTSIMQSNNMRTSDIPKEWVAIAYGSLSGSQNAMFYYDLLSKKVACVPLGVKNLQVLKSWQSFELMLKDVYSRLKISYESSGYKKDMDTNKVLLIRNKTYLQF